MISKEVETMATLERYAKPNMTNLPKEIFDEIINTPRMDYKKMKEEADRLEKQMIKEMEKHEDGNKK